MDKSRVLLLDSIIHRNIEFLKYVLLFLLLVHIGSSTILNNKFIPFTISIVLLIIYFIQTSGKFSRKFIYFFFFWLIINFAAIISTGTDFVLARIIINTLNLVILPYVLIGTFKGEFWSKFENLIFWLTAASLPIYVCNVFFAEYFNTLGPYFSFFTADSFEVNDAYWSLGFYVNAFADEEYGLGGLLRNCGFMWEPGAFAMIIIWAMIYNFSLKPGIITIKIILYAVALFTTISTAGFIAILFVFLAQVFRNIKIKKILISSLFFFFLISFFVKQDFIAAKIENYLSVYKEDLINYNQDDIYIKVNRLQGFQKALERSISYPFGYGVVALEDFSDEVVYGTNGLGSLLEMWGFLGFILLIVLMYRYIKSINPETRSNVTSFFFLLALLVVLFSNPISRNLFAYIIFISPMVYFQEKTIKTKLGYDEK